MCEKGFVVSETLSFNIQRTDTKKNKMMHNVLLNPLTNKSYKANETMKLPALARTLRLVSEYGAEIIYNGNLTTTIVNEINSNGGNVSEKDFENYQASVYENEVIIQLDENYRMYSPPPPSSSILVGYILRLMRGYPLKNKKNMTKSELNLFYHRFVESMKHAYAQRQKLGDKEFVNTNHASFINN